MTGSLSIMSSSFIHVVVCVRTSFLRLNNIPSYVYTTSSSVDTWVVFALGLLWIMLLRTLAYCWVLVLILLGIYSRLKLLSHTVILFNFCNCCCFPVAAPPYIATSKKAQRFQFLHILTNKTFSYLYWHEYLQDQPIIFFKDSEEQAGVKDWVECNKAGPQAWVFLKQTPPLKSSLLFLFS